MFCPQCGSEYREGFDVCSDCQVGLVAELPVDHHGGGRPEMELVTILDSTNPGLIGIAKTVLESAGIEFLAVGENVASVAFSGNPFLGRVRIQVERSRVEEAEALLSEVAESEEPFEDEPPSTS